MSRSDTCNIRRRRPVTQPPLSPKDFLKTNPLVNYAPQLGLVFIKSNIKTQSQGSQETQDNSTTQAAMHSFERQVWMGAISIPSPSPCVNAQSDLKLDRKKITTHKWLREELNPPYPEMAIRFHKRNNQGGRGWALENSAKLQWMKMNG